MVSIGENSNVRIHKHLERQRCDNTNQEEAGECSGISSCYVWMWVMDSEKERKEED